MTIDERLTHLLCAELGMVPDQIMKETPLYRGDEFDNLMSSVEEEFNIYITVEEQVDVDTVGDLTELVKTKVSA